MKQIKTKIIGSIVFYALFSTASMAAIRYNFSEQIDIRSPKPASELFTGYYIFDETTPLRLSDNDGIADYDNPIIEMGFTYRGQTGVFDTCFSASCSDIEIVALHEEHYFVNATLLDSTGTLSATFHLLTGDMVRSLEPSNIDLLSNIGFGGQYSSPPRGPGFIEFDFEAFAGQKFETSGNVWDLVSAGSTSVPEPTSLLLISVGLAFLGFARKK
jgi:hypothetical protein